ncbi:MAG: putative metal-binding motif-containing protein [Kofleriaceae bacterium]
MMTLMACYGMIARPMGPNQGYDRDGDGVGEAVDCDDTRPDVYPGAADLDGDGVDQNCDGVDGWRDPDAPPPPAVAAEPPEPSAAPAIATDPPPPPAGSPPAIAVDPP